MNALCSDFRGLRLPIEYIIDAVGEDDGHCRQENVLIAFFIGPLDDMQYTLFHTI